GRQRVSLAGFLAWRLLPVGCIAFACGFVGISALSYLVTANLRWDAFGLFRGIIAGIIYASVWSACVPAIRRRGIVGAVVLGGLSPIVVSLVWNIGIVLAGLVVQQDVSILTEGIEGLVVMPLWVVYWWYLFLPAGGILGWMTWVLTR
ncbi:MAG TPA: hypothetical protein VG013_32210, partial [Gemmataceae bacterium]|nr:hypothetical protein [Gemmataceae bacterium]